MLSEDQESRPELGLKEGEDGNDSAKDIDKGKRKSFLVSGGEARRDSTMETIRAWGLDQGPCDLRENKYATIPISDTRRLEEAGMRRAGYEHVALVAPVALSPLGAMIADSTISFRRAVEQRRRQARLRVISIDAADLKGRSTMHGQR